MGLEGFRYDAEHQVMVCLWCATCLVPGRGGPGTKTRQNPWESHLRAPPHRLQKQELKTMLALLSECELRDAEELRRRMPDPRTPCRKIKGLATFTGYLCRCNVNEAPCTFVTRSLAGMKNHVPQHGRKAGEHKRSVLRGKVERLWQECLLQSYSTSPSRINYFVVTVQEANAGPGPSSSPSSSSAAVAVAHEHPGQPAADAAFLNEIIQALDDVKRGRERKRALIGTYDRKSTERSLIHTESAMHLERHLEVDAESSSSEPPAMDPLYPFVKLSEYPFVICTLCRFTCVANEVETHLRRHHRDMEKGARRIASLEVQEIPDIIRSQEELRHFQLPEFVEKPIPSITWPKTDGLRCDACPFIARHRQSLQQHCRTEHGWANDRKRIEKFKKEPLEDLPASWTKNVHCQRFSPTRAASGWFEVRQSSTESLETEQQVQFDERQEQRFNMGPESQLKWSEQEESQPGDVWDLVDVAIHHMKDRASIAGDDARYNRLGSASFRDEMGKWLEERCGIGEESIGGGNKIGETDIDVRPDWPVASGNCFAVLRSRGDRRRVAPSSTGTGGGEEDWCEPSVDETNLSLVFDNAMPLSESAMVTSTTAGFRRTQREAQDGQRAQPPFTPKSSSQGPEVPPSGQRVTIKTRSSTTLAAGEYEVKPQG
ncbi:hypothetical protein E4U32_005979 [Claviceps aff. humidiphila group G2b]|nr:hypothetical protein E4U32_005979 [Claviceps aff. humidiphila group G2b]